MIQNQQNQEQNTQSTQQKEEIVTDELVNDLEELIQNQKFDIKKGCLTALIRCLQVEQNRPKFYNKPNFLKAIMNYTTQQDLETTALTCLLQFSVDHEFHEQMHKLDVGNRLVEAIKHKIEEIIEKEFKITKKDILIIELCILVLVNFTQSLLGKNSFLSMDKSDVQQGINIMILMKIYSNQKTAFLMRYFPNILVNISSYETGRKLLVKKENEFLQNCFKFMLCKDRNMRQGIQKTVRNCVFEYENEDFMKVLLSKEIDFINQICLGILIVMNSSVYLSYKGVDKAGERPEKIGVQIEEAFKFMGVDPNTIFTNDVGLSVDVQEIWALVDSLLVLTNVDMSKKEQHHSKRLLEETISLVKLVKFQEEELNDKIEVLCNFYLQ